jgi:hypothetical protein
LSAIIFASGVNSIFDDETAVLDTVAPGFAFAFSKAAY